MTDFLAEHALTGDELDALEQSENDQVLRFRSNVDYISLFEHVQQLQESGASEGDVSFETYVDLVTTAPLSAPVAL